MSNKEKSIFAKALDNDKLEDVAGGATIYHTKQGDLISLSKDEQHLLKMLNFDINPLDSSSGELFANIHGNNRKSYNPREITEILHKDKFKTNSF